MTTQFLLLVGSGGRHNFEASSPMDLLFGVLDGLAQFHGKSFRCDDGCWWFYCGLYVYPEIRGGHRCQWIWNGRLPADPAAHAEELEDVVAEWWKRAA